MEIQQELRFKRECKELLSIYKLKEYRRYGNFFKAKYNKQWKIECSLPEFVWNYLRTPQFASRLMDFMDSITLDELMIKKWLSNANHTIDVDLLFIDEEDDAIEYLEENPNAPHIHIVTQGINTTKSSFIEIDEWCGDLFHGILIDHKSIDLINNVSLTFEIGDDEHTYIVTKTELIDNMEIIYEESSEEDYPTDPTEEKTLVYYYPFFKHPIPLSHLSDNNCEMYVKIIFESDSNDVDIYPLYTMLNEELSKWVNNRTLLLTLKDGDLLRVGANKMKIVHNNN